MSEVLREHGGNPAFERIWNNFKGLGDFYLPVKAITWPWQSYLWYTTITRDRTTGYLVRKKIPP